jgi:hypothetical protein
LKTRQVETLMIAMVRCAAESWNQSAWRDNLS